MSPSSTAPRYSIIITSYRSLRFLEECLGSLLNLSGPSYEVLFLDNGSPDPEAEWARKHIQDPRFRIFDVPKTLFFAGGVNYLAKHATGDFLVLLNSDAKVAPDWLAVLDAYLIRTGYEVAGSDVRHDGLEELQLEARWAQDPFGVVHYLPPLAKPRTFFLAGGCGMAIKRSVWEELGAFDGDFKMYFEEVDLCWRLNLLDYRIGHARGAIIHHVGQGSSTRTFFLWNRFRGRRNRIWSYFKNAGPWVLAVFIPTHFVICLAAIAANLVLLRFRNAVAEAAALAAAVYHARIPFSKRGAIQASRKVSDREFFRREFFVLRIKGLGQIGGDATV
jgi:GT2 family glycosyltransferase